VEDLGLHPTTTHPSSAVVACSGITGCSAALADTQRDESYGKEPYQGGFCAEAGYCVGLSCHRFNLQGIVENTFQ
jgi:hypothetical protein